MAQSPVIMLGIESSCDDTAVSVMKKGKVLANIIASQKIHESWGGVVPELASRAHQANILPTIKRALEKAGVDLKSIDGIEPLVPFEPENYCYQMFGIRAAGRKSRAGFLRQSPPCPRIAGQHGGKYWRSLGPPV